MLARCSGQRTTMASVSGSFRLLFACTDLPRLLALRIILPPSLSIHSLAPSRGLTSRHASFRLLSFRLASRLASSCLVSCRASFCVCFTYYRFTLPRLIRASLLHLPLITGGWSLAPSRTLKIHLQIYLYAFAIDPSFQKSV